MKIYYEILELNENCTVDEIKKSYRNLVKKWHPDINKSPDAINKFRDIQLAYDSLIKGHTNNQHQTYEYDFESYFKKYMEDFIRNAAMNYYEYYTVDNDYFDEMINKSSKIFSIEINPEYDKKTKTFSDYIYISPNFMQQYSLIEIVLNNKSYWFDIDDEIKRTNSIRFAVDKDQYVVNLVKNPFM